MKQHASPQEGVKDQKPEAPNPGSGLNLTERCQTRLSPALQEVLHTAARTADAHHLHVYAVGGFVRDVLLGVRNEDLDLTVEGDGVAFAQHLAAATGGHCKGPSAFGTAVVIAPNGHKIDIASARRETYKQPAALSYARVSPVRNQLAWR